MRRRFDHRADVFRFIPGASDRENQRLLRLPTMIGFAMVPIHFAAVEYHLLIVAGDVMLAQHGEHAPRGRDDKVGADETGDYTIAVTCRGDLEELGQDDDLRFRGAHNVTLEADEAREVDFD